MSRIPTRFQGVYQRESSTRRHRGKPDVCFDITYKAGDVKRWEKVGWTSEGYTAVMASEIRAERIRAIRHGDMEPGRLDKRKRREITLGEAWAVYVERWLPQLKTERSRATDRNRWATHLAQFAERRLSEITPAELEDLKLRLLAQGKAAQTVKHVLCLLRQIYHKAVDWGLWQGEPPTRRVAMPKIDNRRMRFLTRAEADALLEALGVRSPQWADMALLSLDTGLRLGEIAALRRQDVDLAAETLDVRGKTGRRTAYLTKRAAQMLARRCAESPDPGGLLFPARGGGVSREASESFTRTVEALGLNVGVADRLQRVCFHTLRHTYGSWLAQANVPIHTIAELMGHSVIEMTRRYAKLSPDHKRAAVRLLDAPESNPDHGS
jgi:integrase